jgi:hypothetical protein
MCTIYTFDKQTYKDYKKDLETVITLDNAYNNDGLSLVCLDPSNESNDLVIKTFNLGWVLFALDDFMTVCGPEGRVWLHQRAATGFNVNLGTVHGFTDRLGNILMHNGILQHSSRSLYTVDSFSLIDTLPTNSALASLMALARMNEHFANIFIIRPSDYTYGVIRRTTGRLYTDGEGNYSTNPVGKIDKPVPEDTAADFIFGQRPTFKPIVSKTWEHLEPSVFAIGDKVRRDVGAKSYEITGEVIDIVDAFTVTVAWDKPFSELGQEIRESNEDVLDLALLRQETA